LKLVGPTDDYCDFTALGLVGGAHDNERTTIAMHVVVVVERRQEGSIATRVDTTFTPSVLSIVAAMRRGPRR
jgi:hypothetical protein